MPADLSACWPSCTLSCGSGLQRDPHEAGTKAEDGSAGCATATDFAGGGSLPEDLGAELGESRSATAVVASTPDGADAHADHESVARGGLERRGAAQKGAVAAGRACPAGVVSTGSVGQSAAARSAGVTGPTDPENPRAHAIAGAGSGKAASSAAADDASRSGSTDRIGLRVGHRNTRTFSLRKADRQLCGASPFGRVQRGSAETGTHQQTRQHPAALLAGGSGTSHRTLRSRLAASVPTPGPASGKTDRQSSHGPETCGSTLLDVAEGMELRAVEKVRFARGRARKSPGCAVDHRRNDWASRSPFQKGSSK